MFNQLQEEEIEIMKQAQDQSFLPGSQRFSEQEEINFSQNSSRRQKPSSQSIFSKDLNSHASESFLFMKARGNSHDEMRQELLPRQDSGALIQDLKPKHSNQLENSLNTYQQSVLNKLDVNSLSKSQNNIKHKLSDMFGTGSEAFKGKLTEQVLQKSHHKMGQVKLGKREDNRTSIFQTIPKEVNVRRHLDFVNKEEQDLFYQNSGRMRKTEVTRMMSMLGDQLIEQKEKRSFFMSGQKKEDGLEGDWAKMGDDKSNNIKSFGRLWSGLGSHIQHGEENRNYDPESMVNFEKESGSQIQLKKQPGSNQFSEHSKNSLISDLELSYHDLTKGGNKSQKYSISKARKLFTSKVNLEGLQGEETIFTKNMIRNIPEAAEESESSRPSRPNKDQRYSDENSMYISELNDTNSKDRLLLKVLMENSGKKVNINTLNTNFNTVNNNNNNLNYISNQKNQSQVFSENEMQFVKYLNNIKNYYVDPNSKAIFLKIGSEETKEGNVNNEEQNLNPENNTTQLIPLTNFMNTSDPVPSNKINMSKPRGKAYFIKQFKL